MRCDAGDDCRAPELERFNTHVFSGYGMFAQFHPICCPGAMDGSLCMHGHPLGWSSRDPTAVMELLVDLSEEKRRERLEELYDSSEYAPRPPRPEPTMHRIFDRGRMVEMLSVPMRVEQVEAMRAWPGRVRFDGKQVRGFVPGGFWSRRRAFWLLSLARALRPVRLWQLFMAGWEAESDELNSVLIQQRCPHPDSDLWRNTYDDAKFPYEMCTCGRTRRLA